MTSVPRKNSADLARGLESKQNRITMPRQTVHHGQGQGALQFTKKNDVSAHFLSLLLLKWLFFQLVGAWSPGVHLITD